MTADGIIPAPEARQRAVHRHAQDGPSLADLVAALDGAAKASFKASADALKAASETRSLAVSLHRLSALADAWEAEAGGDLTGESGLAREVALKMCARQLRDAITKGVPS